VAIDLTIAFFIIYDIIFQILKTKYQKMKKKKVTLAVLMAIVFSSCNTKKSNGDWDGNDYYTGKDTVINQRTYRGSGLGYWYYMNSNNVTRYYPHTGYSETLPAEAHRQGTFLNSPAHTSNGGKPVSASTFTSSRTSGFGTTSRGGGYSPIS